MPSRRSRRLVRALPAGLLAVSLLAACGDDAGDDAGEGAGEGASTAQDPAPGTTPTLSSRTLMGDPLDDVEARLALLAPANLPGFDRLGPQPPEESAAPEDDSATGCESEVSFEDRFDRARVALTRTDTGYLYLDEARLLVVTSLVSSFQEESAAEAAYDEALADYSGCTRYEEVSETGETTVVEVSSDTDPAGDDVDDQLNLLGEGTWSGPGFDPVDMGFGLSLARVGDSVTMTQVISIGVAEDNTLLGPYTGIAVDRLVAVLDGESPEDVPGPTPTAPPRVRAPLPPGTATYQDYFELDPRFALPD